MRRTGSGITYSPSDLSGFFRSRFATWMNRLALEFPDSAEPDEPGQERELLLGKGAQHEVSVLDRLRSEGRDVVEIPPDGGRLEATREAMRAGADVLYQGALASNRFFGIPDFLVRAETDRATLTAPLYEPLEAKLARGPRPAAIVQLCCYAELLAAGQSACPPRLWLALGSGETPHLRTEEYFHYYLALKRRFLEFMECWDPAARPIPEPHTDHTPWQSHADRALEELDHLSRVARITSLQIRRLESAGIRDVRQLAGTEPSRLPGLTDEVSRRLRTQARLQIASAGRPRPLYEVVSPTPREPRRGLALLPPAGELDAFFDMEGYPLAREPLEYLFGATTVDGARLRFHDWWAHDPDEERRAFEGFVDWVCERRRRDPRMHVYHYGAYETNALKRLMGRFASRENELDGLLRDEVFVDLYQIVRTGLVVGEPRYSIKNIERLFRDARDGEVETAVDSIVSYQRWLDGAEPRDWHESPSLREIRRYNRDDCDSTLLLTRWLRERQTEYGISWAGPAREPATTSAGASPEMAERRELAHRVARIPGVGPEADLLAQLLDFHRREDRPMWWSMFDRHSMTEDELIDDVHCLGGLQRTADPPWDHDRSRIFRYVFDPEQESKLTVGSKCWLAGNLQLDVQLHEMDPETGRAAIRIGQRALEALDGPPPARLSLIPNEFFPASVIERSIARTVRQRLDSAAPATALDDFLARRPPRIDGFRGGPLVALGESPVDAALRLGARMDATTLFLQGPPGSGKTTTAARMIVDLLGRGKTVGIASNSHKAVLNLMKKCAELRNWKLPCLKVGGAADAEWIGRCHGARHFPKNNGAAALIRQLRLVGGTAWLFSRPEMEGRLDHLFVDEAGQVSVANLVGMAPAARNLVLVGDQMQLPQPTQGSHPGDSGLSTLEYLLGDVPTIPPERGVFLGTTYRLHPKLCDMISSLFYEGRLEPASGCAHRVVRVPADPGRIPCEAGILFVPVEHKGNTQASAEEVEVVSKLVHELVGRERTDLDGLPAGRLSAEEILVVAPYNLQVRKLQQRLPASVRVGTVDRFQGQEAPVVIVSLCASEGHGSPRGLEFLLDPNRLNVALSRAQSLALVVGNPALTETRCTTAEQMRRVNILCRITEKGRPG